MNSKYMLRRKNILHGKEKGKKGLAGKSSGNYIVAAVFLSDKIE